VSDAVATIDRLSREYEAATRQKGANLDEKRAALAAARAVGRTAQRILTKHIQHHGCKS
jgi:hypothetical protein